MELLDAINATVTSESETTVNYSIEDLTVTNVVSSLYVSENSAKVNDLMKYVNLYLRIVFLCCLCFFAFTTNIINMVVLVKQGVRSCVSLCIFCLSATDFLSTFAALCTTPPKILMYLNRRNRVDPYAIYFFMVYMSAIFYDVSNTLTAFLSFERCLCVCLPLKFKDIFTIKRGVVVIVCIYLLCFGIYLPHFLTSGLEKRSSGSGNTTYWALWVSPNRAAVDRYINIAVQFCLTVLNMAVVGVCTVLMLLALKRSSRFQDGRKNRGNLGRDSVRESGDKNRESTSRFPSSPTEFAEITSSTDLGEPGTHLRPKDDHVDERFRENGELEVNKLCSNRLTEFSGYIKKESMEFKSGNVRHKRKQKSQSSRNLNVMKTVIILCVICFVSNSTRLALTTSSFVEPRLRFGREFDSYYQLSLSLCYVFQVLNCSLNIFVYYKFNISFRMTLQRVFCCRRLT
ncbi:chemosensory receptor C [Elysia marginata]|uniref:Chemosensory receptor C n=1 Tax=Elysia marginata TaxID=1093978 RepID=A0AAV4FEF6_9GAST|nr:chemosensory receptor C [Elysia marginata]